MADVFKREDVEKLFAKGASDEWGEMREGRTILMIGDSIMRCMYKDFVYLLNSENNDHLTPVRHYRQIWDADEYKGKTHSYQGDKLLNKNYGDQFGGGMDYRASSKTLYREERDFRCPKTDIQVSYFFITRCYSDYLAQLIDLYPKKGWGRYPDIILINSGLWDINRYGKRGLKDYTQNMRFLMDMLKTTLPRYTQVIWCTTPPISCGIIGGFQLHGYQEEWMRVNVMESNNYCANLVACYGYDVLDMHYHLKDIVFRRASDKIHWNPDAVRFQTNLWLTHYCITRKLEHLLPEGWKKTSIGRFYERNQTLDNDQQRNINLEEAMQLVSTADNDFLPVTSDQKVKLLKNKRYFRAVDNRNLPRPDPANRPPECQPDRVRPNFAEHPPGFAPRLSKYDSSPATDRNYRSARRRLADFGRPADRRELGGKRVRWSDCQ